MANQNGIASLNETEIRRPWGNADHSKEWFSYVPLNYSIQSQRLRVCVGFFGHHSRGR